MSLRRQRVPVLDVDATPLRVGELVDTLSGFVAEGRTRTVLGHNLHSVTLYHSNPAFRELYEDGDVVLLDGAPVVMLWGIAYRRGPQAPGDGAMAYRLGSTDWLPALGGVEGLARIAVVGAGQEANQLAVERLRRIVPNADVVGMPGANWAGGVEDRAVSWLHEFRPQLVLLGLGMPLQEAVLRRRMKDLPPAVYCTVGGAIEQLAGVQRLAPRWLGRLGLEWAWRLVLHPGRVAYRVFVEPWVLLGLLARRRFTARRHATEPNRSAGHR